MSGFNRPNPDKWTVRATTATVGFERGELRLELWDTDDEQQWVIVCDDGGSNFTNEHAPVTDRMAAMFLRVVRDE